MRYLRYAFLASLAIVLVSVALANRGMVTLKLLPVELSDWVGLKQSIELPLFVVIFGSILISLFFLESLLRFVAGFSMEDPDHAG